MPRNLSVTVVKMRDCRVFMPSTMRDCRVFMPSTMRDCRVFVGFSYHRACVSFVVCLCVFRFIVPGTSTRSIYIFFFYWHFIGN